MSYLPIFIAYNKGMISISREDLLQLLKNITSIDGKSEEDIDALIDKLKSVTSHPSPTDLIYCSEYSREEIAAILIDHKPIQL